VIRFLFWVGLLVGFVVVGSTVKLGKRTLFGHIHAIWETDEAKDMRHGIEDKAGPVVDKIKRGAKAGWSEATKDDATDAGSGSAGSAGSGSGVAERPAPATP